jgi:hypothetical protein
MVEPAVKPPVRALAAQIYVELVTRATAVTETSVKMTASAENIAKLSFRLASAFQNVEEGLNAESLPKNQDFVLDSQSIASWSK